MKVTFSEENQYRQYIKEHIQNVQKAFSLFGRDLCLFVGVSASDVKDLVEIHDESKYSKEEFEGYRQYFFPMQGEIKSEKIFDKAWKHHYMNNPHHPEYWFYSNDGNISPMPKKYVVEMILDWVAMSMKFKNSPVDWWEKNRDKKAKIMHPETLKLVDDIMALSIWQEYSFI